MNMNRACNFFHIGVTSLKRSYVLSYMTLPLDTTLQLPKNGK